MKYRDTRFLKYQEKQRDGDFDDYWSQKSERQIRREREHGFTTFYKKFLIGRIDKLWWIHLKDSDKQKIISLHSIQAEHMKHNDTDYWYSEPVFDSWKEWYEYINSTFETNKVKVREDRLKSIGL